MASLEVPLTWLSFSTFLLGSLYLYYFPPAWVKRGGGTLLGDIVQMHRMGIHLSFVWVVMAALCGEVPPSARTLWATYLSFNVFLYGAIYIVNGIVDRHEDAQSPIKKDRPFASGRRSVAFGVVYALFLLVLAWITARAWLPPRVLDGYVAALCINASYTFVFRRLPWFAIFSNGVTHALRMWLGTVLALGAPTLAECFVGYFFGTMIIAALYASEGRSLGLGKYRGLPPVYFLRIAAASLGLLLISILVVWQSNMLLAYEALAFVASGLFLGHMSVLTYVVFGVVSIGGGWLCLQRGEDMHNIQWVSSAWLFILGFAPFGLLLLGPRRRIAPWSAPETSQGMEP